MARTTPVHSGYTIVSGTGTGPNGDRIDVWVEYKLGAQSVEGNYTPFTAYFYAALKDGPNISSSTSSTYGLDSAFDVDGVSGATISNGAYDFRSADTVNLLGSYSGNILHGENGKKSVSIEGSFTTRSSYISGGNVSVTIELPGIVRGVVYICDGNNFDAYILYIYNDTAWDHYAIYICDDTVLILYS